MENTNDIISKLNLLADLKADFEVLKAQFEADNALLTENIKNLEEQIKAEVLQSGESVKTDKIMAVWNKGKTTWDSRLLDGYAVAHPEILQARKVGNPTVSFRMTK